MLDSRLDTHEEITIQTIGLAYERGHYDAATDYRQGVPRPEPAENGRPITFDGDNVASAYEYAYRHTWNALRLMDDIADSQNNAAGVKVAALFNADFRALPRLIEPGANHLVTFKEA